MSTTEKTIARLRTAASRCETIGERRALRTETTTIRPVDAATRQYQHEIRMSFGR